MAVHAQIVDRILVLTIDNPPVNALSRTERLELAEKIADANNPEIAGFVVMGQGESFVAGADIREFGKPGEPPHLPDVIAAIERCSRPVIAAIDGQALGAGLELALGCHFRICTSTAKLGLPEVSLGITPGAGGTQRLPRLIDPILAARMISGGKPIGAQTAIDAGLVDRIATGNLLVDALRFFKEISDIDLDTRRLSTRSPVWNAETYEKLRDLKLEIKSRLRGATAPGRAVDLVTLVGTSSWGDAIHEERATFLALRGSEQAAAMRHIFFAERAAAKPSSSAIQTPILPIRHVGVIGAGTMGSGIAMTIADAGLPVILIEQSSEALERGLRRIMETYRSSVKRGKLDGAEAERRISSITGSTNFAALAHADLIVEAAFEAMPVKTEIFKKLDLVAKPNAILATNTSYLDINVIASATTRAKSVVGLHYFSPANVMALLEIVRGDYTSEVVIATALGFARKTGKTAVVSGVCHGFIGNRMLRAYMREAGLLLLEGATPEQVDGALVAFGMAMGPFAVADLAGIDIGFKARQEMPPGSFEPAATYVHDALVESGMLGQKTGIGFYRYESDQKRKTPNPLVGEWIGQAREKYSVHARGVVETEIIDRCVFALANEAFRIFEEGIAARISDTDVVFVNGYGFPRHRGGPAFYAEQVGLEHVLGRIKIFQKGAFGHWWRPAGALLHQHSTLPTPQSNTTTPRTSQA